MGVMDVTLGPQAIALAGAGVVAGLWLLLRGMRGHRTAIRIGDTSSSTIASMAAGEVRISGVIEPGEVSLVSALQGATCVYYRASVEYDDDRGPDLDEERAIGFRVRDASGDIRVFPRGARWDAPMRFDDRSEANGAPPPGLAPRTGPSTTVGAPDREAAIAALLSVRVATLDAADRFARAGRGRAGRAGARYREARLEPGDTVTIVGRAMPFADLSDPGEADIAIGHEVPADDPEVAASIAEARAAGILAADPEAAWGNAAIPGFGIGRPVRTPALDPDATASSLAAPDEAARFERTFAIAPETLVLASAPGVPLLVAHGAPGVAVERHEDRFILGLLGAVLAIGSAMALAVAFSGSFG